MLFGLDSSMDLMVNVVTNYSVQETNAAYISPPHLTKPTGGVKLIMYLIEE